ncbi:MAG: uroporphyrinogen decarboxylase family protein, partial [Dehalococcoidia bacterium]
ENASMDQFVEGEYMKADEYDALLKDPSDYCLRFYLPRTMGALEPLQKLIPLRSTLGLPTMFLAACTAPDVQATFQAIIDAGKELANFQEVVREINTEARAAGFPSLTGGFAHAPFDLLGDTLRGTHGIVMDMYRQPDKLLEAMEIVTPWIIETGIAGANASGGPIILMPLHKGDDTFMSDKQFETFYWPYLRKVIVGLVNEGCMPLLFAEGSYNRRLETVKDVPKGSVLWWFDKTDMTRAKEILGDTACISGNVPTSLMRNGTPQAVKQYCINLIEDCGKGGGGYLNRGCLY